MKELKLDEDKPGLKTFADKAKAADLDPLEMFWVFSKKRAGLKTWKEFQVLLDEYVAAKNEADKVGGKSESSPTESEKSPESDASATSSDEQKTSSDGEADLFQTSGQSEATDEANGAAEKPSSGTSSPNSEAESKLKAEYDKSRDKATILKRATALDLALDDLIRDVAAANPKARLVDLVAALDEAETHSDRGR
jgi:hypothetical protein